MNNAGDYDKSLLGSNSTLIEVHLKPVPWITAMLFLAAANHMDNLHPKQTLRTCDDLAFHVTFHEHRRTSRRLEKQGAASEPPGAKAASTKCSIHMLSLQAIRFQAISL